MWGSGDGGMDRLLPHGDSPIYLEPVVDPSVLSGVGLPLAGGPLRFTHICVALRSADSVVRATGSLADVEVLARRLGRVEEVEHTLDRLVRARPAWAGFGTECPRLMGVINVTPDSFFDGGRFANSTEAIAAARVLFGEGADLVDVGGESTRPGASPVAPEIEEQRIGAVVTALAGEGLAVSVDTRNVATMRSMIAAGCRVVNDVSGLGSADAVALVAAAGTPVCVMHMLGDPLTMQDQPSFIDAPLDVFDWFVGRLGELRKAGLDDRNIVIDPGIGFGKTTAHNLSLIRHAALFHGLGLPLLFGVSRKSFIAASAPPAPPAFRLPGSLAAALALAGRGVHWLRVHDVAATRQALLLHGAICGAG